MSSYVALAMMISGLDFEVMTNENTDPLAHFTAATFSFKSDKFGDLDSLSTHFIFFSPSRVDGILDWTCYIHNKPSICVIYPPFF